MEASVLTVRSRSVTFTVAYTAQQALTVATSFGTKSVVIIYRPHTQQHSNIASEQAFISLCSIGIYLCKSIKTVAK